MIGAERLPERIIGLDIGTHRIGVAVSDELQMIASPETTLLVAQHAGGEGEAMNEIVALAQRYGARRVVVGLPGNMKGERGVQATWTEQFVTRLRSMLQPLGIYISQVDERLTSVQAARTYQERRGKSRGAWPRDAQADRAGHGRSRSTQPPREGRTSLDARAAALILQTYLDQRRNRAMSRHLPGEEQ